MLQGSDRVHRMSASQMDLHEDTAQGPEESPERASPVLSIRSFSGAEDLDAALAPFRQVALEQSSRSNMQMAAPTVVDFDEPLPAKIAPSNDHASLDRPDPKQSLGARKGRLPANEATRFHMPTEATTQFHINAQIVNVYQNLPPGCHHDKLPQPVSAPKAFQFRSRPEQGTADVSVQSADARPTWQIWQTTDHVDHSGEANEHQTNAQVYSDATNFQNRTSYGALGDIPLSTTAPPDFLDNDHLVAMHVAATHPNVCAPSEDVDGATDPVTMSRGEVSRDDMQDKVLLDPRPSGCPQGKEDCDCQPESIELFKNAATYLYKHTRTLSQEFFQAHVHVGERIERLHQINALNGGPTLPGSVHEFLQTETSQLLQDWAIAESKCSQYMCDCILADVNGYELNEPSESTARGIPPDVTDPEEVIDETNSHGDVNSGPREDSEGSTTSSIRAQCSERFAELKTDLIQLTERSERVKRQWANLLDLCNKLDEVAQIGRVAGPSEEVGQNAAASREDWMKPADQFPQAGAVENRVEANKSTQTDGM